MVNRGLFWSILGVAGSATAIVIAYRYLNTAVVEEPPHLVEDTVQEQVDEPEEVSNSERVHINGAHQLSITQREGNVVHCRFFCTFESTTLPTMQFLSLFSLIFMLLVGLVGFFVVLTSNEASSVAQLPMFPPLMWIAIGMFAGMYHIEQYLLETYLTCVSGKRRVSQSDQCTPCSWSESHT